MACPPPSSQIRVQTQHATVGASTFRKQQEKPLLKGLSGRSAKHARRSGPLGCFEGQCAYCIITTRDLQVNRLTSRKPSLGRASLGRDAAQAPLATLARLHSSDAILPSRSAQQQVAPNTVWWQCTAGAATGPLHRASIWGAHHNGCYFSSPGGRRAHDSPLTHGLSGVI